MSSSFQKIVRVLTKFYILKSFWIFLSFWNIRNLSRWKQMFLQMNWFINFLGLLRSPSKYPFFFKHSELSILFLILQNSKWSMEQFSVKLKKNSALLKKKVLIWFNSKNPIKCRKYSVTSIIRPLWSEISCLKLNFPLLAWGACWHTTPQ